MFRANGYEEDLTLGTVYQIILFIFVLSWRLIGAAAISEEDFMR